MQTKLTNEMLSKDFFKDVKFFLLASSGAMFDAGVFRFIKQDKTEYFFNITEEEVEYSKVVECFPILGEYTCSGSDENKTRPKGWHMIYLGLGISMVIHDEVFDTFKQLYLEAPKGTYTLFRDWRKLVYKTLDSKN